MRKKDKEISEPAIISEIIRSAAVCRLGLARDDTPYVVPLVFGYDGKCIYIHTALEGKKIDFIQANNRVCAEFEREVQIRSHPEKPCKWTVSFQSVIADGRIDELVDPEDKITGLGHIMAHYADRSWVFDEKALAVTRVWRITVTALTGKRSADRRSD